MSWPSAEAIIEASLMLVVLAVIGTGLVQNVLAIVQLAIAMRELARN